jgi:hypothetical protein
VEEKKDKQYRKEELQGLFNEDNGSPSQGISKP